MNWVLALAVLKKLWPVAVKIAASLQDGKITKDEVILIAEDILGEDDVIYIWGSPSAK